MQKFYNVYCDESCHLEKDNSDVMVLGAIQCLNDNKNQIYDDIRNLKIQHGLSSYFEIKWTKVSNSKIEFYLDLLEYFFTNDFLTYRGLVVLGKRHLNHAKYNNSDYDLWYYKMYYLMLEQVIKPSNTYKVFIDIKDTKGGKRVIKLKDVLCNNIYDFKRDVIKDIYQIDSKESELIQLADLISGALGYYNRHLYRLETSNQGKSRFIEVLESKVNLNKSSARNEEKFNMLIWQPQKLDGGRYYD